MKALILSFSLFLSNFCLAENANSVLTVNSLHQSDVKIAQDYVATYFKKYGLELQKPIYFKSIKDIDFPLANPGKVIGIYNSDLRTIYINDFTNLEKENIIVFGEPLTRELYMSYLIHEIAHAYIHDNWKKNDNNILLHEFLAYSIQLESLPAEISKNIFVKNPITEGAQLEDILPIHDFSPFRFALYSYHYFKSQNDNYIYEFLSKNIKP